MRRRQSGYTLVEVLVVIAILGILAAMLIPMINYVRERGVRTSCMGNIRQLASAFELYKAEWKGFYPHEDRDSLAIQAPLSAGNFCWFDRIDPYLGTTRYLARTKQCPGWDGYTSAMEDTVDVHSYKMNQWLEQATRPWTQDIPNDIYYWFPVQRARTPSRTILLFDGSVTTFGTNTHGSWTDTQNRHFGGVNLVFVDLHVDYFDAAGEGIMNPDERGWTADGSATSAQLIWNPF